MYEKEIVKILQKKGEPIGINEIVEELAKMKKQKISYNTVKMSLKDMIISGEICGKAIGSKQRKTWVFWVPKK
jgi:repressor of nif and glnA expression